MVTRLQATAPAPLARGRGTAWWPRRRRMRRGRWRRAQTAWPAQAACAAWCCSPTPCCSAAAPTGAPALAWLFLPSAALLDCTLAPGRAAVCEELVLRDERCPGTHRYVIKWDVSKGELGAPLQRIPMLRPDQVCAARARPQPLRNIAAERAAASRRAPASASLHADGRGQAAGATGPGLPAQLRGVHRR